MHIDLVHKCLERQAERQSRKKYLFFNDEKFTYRDINKRANRLAHILIEKGINKGDRVAVMLENSPEFFVTFFGILKSGGIAIPVNTFLKQEEVAYMINDSQAKFFVTSQNFENVATGIKALCENLSSVIAYTETSFSSDNVNTSAVINENNPEIEITKDDLAVFIYSSGTTGHPKGAMLTHSNMTSNTAACLARFKVTIKDRFLLFLPAFHSYAMMTCIILPTYVGSSIIILESVNDLKKKTFKKILLYKRPTFSSVFRRFIWHS